MKDRMDGKSDTSESTENVKIEEDLFIKSIGAIGKWQIWVCASLFLIKLPSGWNQLSIIFLAPPMAFQCADTESNAPDQFDSICHDNCSRYIFDTSIFENTIISEWSLICDRNWLMNITQSILMFGLLVGSSGFGFFADRFGRRDTFLVSVIVLIVSCFATSFAPEFWSFSAIRFFVGLGCGGTMNVSFVICMEIIGPKYREVVGSLYQIPFILGNLTLPIFAYYLRTWNSYLLGISIPLIIFVGYYWTLPESPRWLIANGKIDEAAKIITRAAQINKLPTDDIVQNVQELAADFKQAKGITEEKPNFIDLIRLPTLRIKTFCSCYMWLAAGLYFYGVSQYISQTSSNIFISVALSAAIQIPGNLLAIYFNRVFGRKKTTIVSYLLSGLSMFIIGYVPLSPWVRLAISCLGVSCIGVSFATIYIYSSELFPTVVRNMGMGMSSTVSRVGSIAAPFIAGLSSTAAWLPPTIFGTAALTAALVCLALPETNGKKLPDNLNDAEK